MQKRNDNYFGFKILCHLNKKKTLKTVAEKKLFIFAFLFVFFFVLPKKLKAS